MKRTILILVIVIIFCGLSSSPTYIYGSGTTVIDYCSEEHIFRPATWDVWGSFVNSVAQSFTGDGRTLDHCQFFLGRAFSPTGSIYAKLYAHSGTYGTSSMPIGAALATSDPVDIANIPDQFGGLVTFSFPTPYRLINGTRYVLAVEFNGGNSTNKLYVYSDTGGNYHSGNSISSSLGSWHAWATDDLIFYAISDQIPNVPDTTGPSLSITSHSNGQHVSAASITLAGTASDSGRGDNGIQQVTVNGVQASGGAATGSGTANWNRVVSLNAGANTITVVAYDNSANYNTTTQSLTIYYDIPDTMGPSLAVTSHSNGQHVSAASITLAGTASDSGKGDNGIQQVTVNGTQASSGLATGSGTANWNKVVSLNAGANTISVVAYDNSANHNTTTQTLTIYRDAEQISPPKTPKGVSTGYTGKFYNFSTGRTSSDVQHPVEYQFDWKGDGISDLSAWGSALQAKVWGVVGTYQIRAKARYTLQPDIESEWSASISVSVSAKPFIHVLSPNGGEAWVTGTTHTVSWESGYLNPAGTVYLCYRYDNAWHPIATLPSTATSYDWTIPEMPQGVTTPAPMGRIKTASIWIGNWLGDSWECWNSSDKAFVILHDAWVFNLSNGDRGGALLDFQEGTTEGTGQFEGYGVSLELGAFGISGTYDFDEKGFIHGNYTLFDSYDLTNASVLESGNLTGGLNQQGRLIFNLKTPGGPYLFTMTGDRFFQELVVPKDWTATLTLPRFVKGTLGTLTIDPYQDPITNEVYSQVFEISGSGMIPDHGSIDIEGQVFITLTTIRRGENLAYGTYSLSGYLSETGVLSGTMNPGLGTFNLTATSSSGTRYTLTGKVK